MNATAKHPLTGGHAKLFEQWLQPNGIVGWLPEHATIVVNTDAGTVTWPKWRHLGAASGPWEEDLMVVSDRWTDKQRRSFTRDPGAPVVDKVTVPLAVPVTPEVRVMCRKLGLNLVEVA